MYKRLIFLSVIFLFIFSGLWGQSTSFTGKAPDYAKQIIPVYMSPNPINPEKKYMLSFSPKPNGEFQFSIDLEEPGFVYFQLGPFMGELFVCPNKTYIISFPQRQERTKADRYDPFFQHILFRINIHNEQEHPVNKEFEKFDSLFNSYIDQNISGIISGNLGAANIKKHLNTIEENFKNKEQKFFSDYRNYKYYFVNYLASRSNKKKCMIDAFASQNPLYKNPAYTILFNRVFDKFFMQNFPLETEQKIILAVLRHKSVDMLREAIKSHTGINNKNTLDLIIIKAIHDSFYEGDFSKPALIEFMQEYMKNPDISSKNLAVANEVYAEFTKLKKNDSLAKYSLLSNRGEALFVKANGKHLLLHLYEEGNPACIADTVSLSDIRNRFKDKIEIRTIFFSKNAGSPPISNPFTWDWVIPADEYQCKDFFDIKAFPRYYLVDENLKVLWDYTPRPTEDLEQRLHQLFK